MLAMPETPRNLPLANPTSSSVVALPSRSLEGAQQLALALFAELAPVGGSIADVPGDIGFQRNNIFLDISDLSLCARRAIDVAYFLAAEDTAIHSRYEVPLTYFKWLMAYGSNNHKHLRHVLREGQKAAVQVQDIDASNEANDRWISVQLLGTVGIARGKVFFEIAPVLQPHIKSPASSHFLSLRYVFKSLYAKILYEKLLPHMAAGATPWISVETLREWFELGSDSYTEFKRLSARTLKPGVTHITEVTGMDVTYVTRNHPGTKRVSHVSFRMRAAPGAADPKAPMLVLKELYFTLRDEFGLSGAQLQEIINHRDEWTDDRLMRAIEYTRFHLQQGKVRHPAGYLLHAVEGDYTLGEAVKQVTRQQSEHNEEQTRRAQLQEQLQARRQQAQDKDSERRRQEGLEGYQEFLALDETQQACVLQGFYATPAARVYAIQKKVAKDEIGARVAHEEQLQLALGRFFVNEWAGQGRAVA